MIAIDRLPRYAYTGPAGPARSPTSKTMISGRPARSSCGCGIDWAERQFRAMGRRDARDLAVALIASYQGIMLLTNTFREPELIVREARRLDRWIDSLA
jgi:hypothetical protein